MKKTKKAPPNDKFFAQIQHELSKAHQLLERNHHVQAMNLFKHTINKTQSAMNIMKSSLTSEEKSQLLNQHVEKIIISEKKNVQNKIDKNLMENFENESKNIMEERNIQKILDEADLNFKEKNFSSGIEIYDRSIELGYQTLDSKKFVLFFESLIKELNYFTMELLNKNGIDDASLILNKCLEWTLPGRLGNNTFLSLRVLIYNNLGTLHTRSIDLKKAYQYLIKAVNLCILETHNNYKPLTFLNYSTLLFQLGDIEQSKEYAMLSIESMNKSLKIQQLNSENKLIVALANQILGKAEIRNGNVKKALFYYSSSFELIKTVLSQNNYLYQIILNDLELVQESLKKSPEQLNNFESPYQNRTNLQKQEKCLMRVRTFSKNGLDVRQNMTSSSKNRFPSTVKYNRGNESERQNRNNSSDSKIKLLAKENELHLDKKKNPENYVQKISEKNFEKKIETFSTESKSNIYLISKIKRIIRKLLAVSIICKRKDVVIIKKDLVYQIKASSNRKLSSSENSKRYSKLLVFYSRFEKNLVFHVTLLKPVINCYQYSIDCSKLIKEDNIDDQHKYILMSISNEILQNISLFDLERLTLDRWISQENYTVPIEIFTNEKSYKLIFKTFVKCEIQFPEVKIFEKKLNFLTENKVYTLQARFYDNQLKLGINKEGVKEIILSMPAKIEKIKNFCNEILNNAIILGKQNKYELVLSKRWSSYVNQDNIYRILKEKNRDFDHVFCSSKICEKDNIIYLINYNKHEGINKYEITLSVKKQEKFLLIERFIAAPITKEKLDNESFYKINLNLSSLQQKINLIQRFNMQKRKNEENNKTSVINRSVLLIQAFFKMKRHLRKKHQKFKCISNDENNDFNNKNPDDLLRAILFIQNFFRYKHILKKKKKIVEIKDNHKKNVKKSILKNNKFDILTETSTNSKNRSKISNNGSPIKKLEENFTPKKKESSKQLMKNKKNINYESKNKIEKQIVDKNESKNNKTSKIEIKKQTLKKIDSDNDNNTNKLEQSILRSVKFIQAIFRFKKNKKSLKKTITNKITEKVSKKNSNKKKKIPNKIEESKTKLIFSEKHENKNEEDQMLRSVKLIQAIFRFKKNMEKKREKTKKKNDYSLITKKLEQKIKDPEKENILRSVKFIQAVFRFKKKLKKKNEKSKQNKVGKNNENNEISGSQKELEKKNTDQKILKSAIFLQNFIRFKRIKRSVLFLQTFLKFKKIKKKNKNPQVMQSLLKPAEKEKIDLYLNRSVLYIQTVFRFKRHLRKNKKGISKNENFPKIQKEKETFFTNHNEKIEKYLPLPSILEDPEKKIERSILFIQTLFRFKLQIRKNKKEISKKKIITKIQIEKETFSKKHNEKIEKYLPLPSILEDPEKKVERSILFIQALFRFNQIQIKNKNKNKHLIIKKKEKIKRQEKKMDKQLERNILFIQAFFRFKKSKQKKTNLLKVSKDEFNINDKKLERGVLMIQTLFRFKKIKEKIKREKKNLHS